MTQPSVRRAPAGLSQAMTSLRVATRGPGFVDITREVAEWLRGENVSDGLFTVFIRHTSASLVIQENADPDVQADLTDALRRFAPENAGYRHTCEGPDDMPAHIKSMLTATSIGIPVEAGRMVLGTWQGLYVVEHRARPHMREVVCQFVGTVAG